MVIQDFFAKNGYIRNVIFIIAASLAIVLMLTSYLMGHAFLKSAPTLILATIAGLIFFWKSKLYLPFCVGAMLQFGLFSGLMGLLLVGPVPGVFIDFTIGIMGYIMLITSIWQAVLGEWNLSKITNYCIQIVSILGLIFCIVVTVIMEKHGIPVEKTAHITTY